MSFVGGHDEYLYTGQAGISLWFIGVTNQCLMLKWYVSPSVVCHRDTLYEIRAHSLYTDVLVAHDQKYIED